MKFVTLILVYVFTLNLSAQDSAEVIEKTPILKGEYLGQKLPGRIPELFAPGFISTKNNLEGCSTFSKDGTHFYFTKTEGMNPYGKTYIMVSRMIDSVWTEPEIASFSGEFLDFEPNITPDGQKFYFNRFNQADADFNNGIWVMNKTADGWSDPEFFRNGMFITTSENGTIYYTDIADPSRDLVKEEFINGAYKTAEVLEGVDGEYFDAHPCIAPDESYIIYDSKRPDRNSYSDIYVAFKNDDGTWGKSYHLGRRLGLGYKMTASLTPDGKYLFYYSNGDIYWVDTKIIYDMIE